MFERFIQGGLFGAALFLGFLIGHIYTLYAMTLPLGY
jgi:hypothetical protein